MGFFKSIIKTVKELNDADSNNQLGEYVSGKITNIVNEYDGTNEKNLEARKERLFEALYEEIGKEEFDNEQVQYLADTILNELDPSEHDCMVCYYYKYLGWEKKKTILIDKRREDSYDELPSEEQEEDKYLTEQYRDNCLDNLNQAIEFLSEDTAASLCTLFLSKAELLREKGEDMEAMHLAIQAMPYATDEDEKQWAKNVMTGKLLEGEDFIIPAGGYGLSGMDIEQRINYNLYGLRGMDIELKIHYNLGGDGNELPIGECNEDTFNDIQFFCDFYSEEVDRIRNGLESFQNRPYHDRQFIFLVRDLDHIGGCYDDTDTIKYVFPLDEMPGGIKFPVGHPQPNMLYYAHPLRPMYLPFENAQLLLLYEKVQEICRLFQCLGATKITTRCLKGSKMSQDMIASYNADMAGGYKAFNASGSGSHKQTRNETKENKDEMSLTQTFSPKKAPYCPDDLLWAKEDPELQTFIRQRLEGGLLEFSKKVSSYETSSLSQNLINDVKGAFNFLMTNVSANYSSESDCTFNSTYETEWEINVEFKPLDEFEEKPVEAKKFSENDLVMSVEGFCPYNDYGVMLLGTMQEGIKTGDKVMVIDNEHSFESVVKHIVVFVPDVNGKISSIAPLGGANKGDRVLLSLSGVELYNVSRNTKVYMLNAETASDTSTIKAEKADTQETTPIVQTETIELTENEEKYKEEILFCLEDDGVISDNDRKYLERKRVRFGVSEERAMLIEKQCTTVLTDDEQEYLETFKELYADGTVSERMRKLLERERISLGISEERALQIERMITK